MVIEWIYDKIYQMCNTILFGMYFSAFICHNDDRSRPIDEIRYTTQKVKINPKQGNYGQFCELVDKLR